MKFIRSFLSNSVFPLNVLLVFLVIFRDRLVIPVWLQPIGRMHPLLLHLPIGLLVLSTLMVLFRTGFKKKAFHNFLNFVLYFSAFTAVLTALMGLLLSREGGYNPDNLETHLFSGVAVSLLATGLLWTSLYTTQTGLLYLVMTANALVLVVAGHYGSVLTHGEGYVLQPLNKNKKEIITDSTSLYTAAVYPLFKAKCISCHNERKVKGDLNMESLDKILKGGKHGPIWVAGRPDSSDVIRRIHLAEHLDDHMPPAGKTQLTSKEKELLYLWIKGGADVKKAWTRFAQGDSLRTLAEGIIKAPKEEAKVSYAFSSASRDVIAKLNTPYCTVTPISSDEPALQADFFLSQAYDSRNLEALLSVKEQLVVLNLAKMPVTDAEAKTISQFRNLEELNLNQTSITGTLLGSLKGLGHLRSLSITGTAVDKNSIEQIAGLPALKEVFAWNTKLPQEDQEELRKKYKGIAWNLGYPSSETLRLTPPLLVNENFLLDEKEPIVLKHNLPGTEIRYTLDSPAPDSTTGTVYKGPVHISQYAVIRAKAFKPGWYGSGMTEFYFFKKGITPTSAELLNPAEKDYKGEGATTLINNKKGMADNFRDVAWLGYRFKPLIAVFTMDNSPTVKSVTLSYCESFSSYLMPPASVELWGGEDLRNLKLLQKIVPVQPTENHAPLVKGIVFDLHSANYKYYKIIAQPVSRVPVWVSKKPEKGWIFVDEVIFN